MSTTLTRTPAQATSTSPAGTASTPAADKFDQLWASMPTADRVVLLGHDRPDLTTADKIRLAAMLRRLGAQARGAGRPRQRGKGRTRGRGARTR